MSLKQIQDSIARNGNVRIKIIDLFKNCYGKSDVELTQNELTEFINDIAETRNKEIDKVLVVGGD